MSKTITVTLPDFIEEVNGVKATINPDKWTDEQAREIAPKLFLQGIRIILQREKSGQPLDVRQKAIDAKADEIQNATVRFGAGGGGSRQNPTTKGWIAFLNQLKHKENGKVISGNNLERAQETLCRKWMLKVKADEVPVDQVNAKLAEYLPQFVAWMETNNEGLIGKIEYFKLEKAAESITLGF